jgi:hypothetical protein
MKKITKFAMSAVLLASVSSAAFADGRTRAQVEQDLAVAEQNGSQYVTDTSYPSVAPVYREEVAALRQGQANTALAANAASAAQGTGVATAH